MSYSLTWLPDVLRAAGLKVAETEGWANRGRGDMGTIKGVMCHHTGVRAPGVMPTLRSLIEGRGGVHPLPGPLAQLGLGREGTYYLVAAGRANHAGAGEWKGLRTGNTSFIGIEAENSGVAGDVWPDYQMDAFRRGVAAILTHIGQDETMCCGHKEYALPRGRKPDPLFDMETFRAEVRAIMRGTAIVRPSVPAVDPGTQKPTLDRNARGDAVRELQTALGIGVDGKFGPLTEVAVRKFQLLHGLREDGVVGPKTWAVIADAARMGAAVPASPVDHVPDGGRLLLDFIGSAEAPKGYDTLYGNNPMPSGRRLTELSLNEVIVAGPDWSRRFGSPACGRYQFMPRTLNGLRDGLKLAGSEIFAPEFQDFLGFTLLKRRGYGKFKSGELTAVDFGLGLAQEWASFPVLADRQGSQRWVKRGETYYSGDGRNKALVTPEAVEAVLARVSTATA